MRGWRSIAVCCTLVAGASAGSLVQQAYVKASNSGAGDQFGWSVAVSGDTLVVGAFAEDSSATGVDGDEGNDAAPDSGAAYVFVRNGSSWTQQAYLKASNTGANDDFGIAVAVSGDTIVVGASGEASGATGVNGNQADNGAPSAGAAYVFVRNGTTWTQQAYLKASNAESGDQFGGTVAIDGDSVVVGAIFEDSKATGVNGDQSDNSAPVAGAAYVFVRNGTSWSQQAYLKASNTGTGDAVNDNFGSAVGVSGDTVVVSADAEDSNATGVNGNQSDNSAPSAGAAYVFVRSGTSWSQQAYLKASNTGAGDQFGDWAAISGDTIVVGAGTEDSNATGVNGDQANDAASAAGAAYVFVRSGATWTQQAYLKASNTGANDHFGRAVAVSGDRLVVGAFQEDSDATGIDGNQTNDNASAAGAAYVFARHGTTWTQAAYLKASNTGAGDFFGLSVAISGSTVAVGASKEDSSATGVDGDGSNNGATDSGAAYVAAFTPWTDLGFGLAGAGGVPQLVGSGELLGGDAVSLALADASPSAPLMLFVSLASSPVAFKGGTLVPFPIALGVALVTLPDGTLPLISIWPTGIPPGTSFWFQDAIHDLAAVHEVALSNAVEATTP